MEVVGKRVSCFEEMKEPGCFEWLIWDDEKHPRRLHFVCPCGCGAIGGVVVRGDATKEPIWEWDGNLDKPTITPSIRFLDKCCWHGYLTAGVFRSC